MTNGSGNQSIPPSPPSNMRIYDPEKDVLTRFEVRAKRLPGFVDHTYVSCPDINKTFTCFAMLGVGDRLINSDMGCYDVANRYRQPCVLPDTAGIFPYGIDGVCHQAANRFLLATNNRIQLNNQVGGYLLSVALYGAYGKSFPLWYIRYFYEPIIAQTMSAKLTEGEMNLSEHDIISNAAYDLASPIIPNVNPMKLKEDNVDLLVEKDKVIDSGMRGEKMANKINELVAVFTKNLASQLTDSEYQNMVGTQKGEEVLVVDPEIAAKHSKLNHEG